MDKIELLHALRLVLSKIHDVIIIRNQKGDIIYCNKDINSIDYIKLTLFGQRNNEFKIDNKIYKCNKSSITIENEKCDLEIYCDNTKILELKEKSETDHLTNLINKRGIEFEMNKIQTDYLSNPIPFTMIMGDIDNFKKINDTIGHQNGDQVLKVIASIIKSNIRNNDIAGRYGGEEFLIILKSCDINRAYDIIEKIRNNINDFPFSFEEINNITMSFGISSYDGTKSVEEVLEEADKALYESKNNGRNKTTIYKSKTYKKSK